MTTYQDIHLPSGHTWNIHLYSITIPECETSGLSEEAIGEYVMALLDVLPAWREEYYGSKPRHRRRILTTPASDPLYQRLVERDGERCQVPGCRNKQLHIDHIVPRSAGGSDKLSNLQLLCRHHNLSKGAWNWKRYLGQLWQDFQQQYGEQLRTLREWEAIGYHLEDAHE